MTGTSKPLSQPDLTEETLRRRIGARIARLRERRGWSQGELARRLGVGRARLGKWETGEHAPPLLHLVALKAAFGVSLDALVEGGQERGPDLTAEERAGAEKAVEILTQWLRRAAPEPIAKPEGDPP